MTALLRRPVVAALVAVVVLAALGAGAWAYVTSGRRADDDALRAAVDRLAAAWAAGSLGDLTWAPAEPGTAEVVPGDAAAAVVAGLTAQDVDRPISVEVTGVERDGREPQASAGLEVTWALDAVSPAQDWTYPTTAEFVRDADGNWAPRWSPTTVHPDLEDGEVLSTTRLRPVRGDVVAGDGTAIVTSRPVVRVSLRPDVMDDPEATARQVADVVGVDAAGLVERVRAAPAGAEVPVITLRQAAFEAVRPDLAEVGGLVVRDDELPLAPSAGFARALLGTAGEATAEIVEESDGRVAAGDVTGLSGLQRSEDATLAGSPGVRVTAAPPTDDAAPRTVFEVAAVDGAPVRLTLDVRTQQAAEAALEGATSPAGLVAMRASTGEVLAVANGGPAASGYNRALVGQYPPGSTFKVVSTYALLRAGLSPTETVDCPATYSVGGKSFRNFEGGALGAVPFRRDFAQSCNTAFVSLSGRIGQDDLAAAAADLGVGAPASLGVDAFTGSLPTDGDEVEHAANMIGQGRVLASPLTMAAVSAAVASGRFTPPSLVTEPGQEAAAPVPLDPEATATLRALMREVVTDGSGTAVRSAPGGPVSAKTGTAEYGSEVPPRTHAWMTGFQGDVAFALVVEDGASGGQVAGPLVADFVSRLGG